MTVLTYPVGIRMDRVGYWYCKFVSQNFSRWDGGANTVENPGPRWVGQFVYTKLDESEWRVISSFLTSMRGMSGRALVAAPHIRKPRGLAGGYPVVVAGDGASLSTQGWPPNVSGVLLDGDYLQFNTTAGTELKLVKGSIDSDADGFATIPIEPPVRNNPVAGTSIIVQSPACIMRLKDDDQAKAAYEGYRKGSFSVELVEEWG